MNRSYLFFIIILFNLVLIGSFAMFNFNLNENDEYLFDYNLESEDLDISFPPFLNQSESYSNLTENDENHLIVDENSSEGFFLSDTFNGTEQRLVSWDLLEYDMEKVSGNSSLIIESSDCENFTELNNKRVIDLQNNFKTVDLSDFDKSRFLRIEVTLFDNSELSELNIFGETLIGRNKNLNFLYYSIIAILLTIHFFSFIAILSSFVK